MQTNSDGAKKIIKSSGSFWGGSSAAQPSQDVHKADTPKMPTPEVESPIDLTAEDHAPDTPVLEANQDEPTVAAPEEDAAKEDVSSEDVPEEVAPKEDASPEDVPEEVAPARDVPEEEASEQLTSKQKTPAQHASSSRKEPPASRTKEKPGVQKAHEVEKTPTDIDSASDVPAHVPSARKKRTQANAKGAERPVLETSQPDAPKQAEEGPVEVTPSPEDAPVSPAPTSSDEKRPRRVPIFKFRKAKPKPLTPDEAEKKAPPKNDDSKDMPISEDEEDVSTDEGTPIVRAGKKLWVHRRIVVIVFAVILVLIYAGGFAFFSSHFLPHTTVNGNDVSMMSRDAFEELISSQTQDYTAQVVGDGIDLAVAGSEVGLSLDAPTYLEAATSQVPAWAWPVAAFLQQSYIVNEGVSLDESKLSTALSATIQKANANSTPTTDATIYYDADTDSFQTVPEKLGTELDPERVKTTVATNMEGLTPRIALGDNELVQPNVTVGDSQFKDALKAVKNFPDLKLKLVMGGDVVKTLDNELVRSWLTVADDFSIAGDEDAIAYYTRFTLSSELDSVGGYRTYTRPDGKTININDGTYGWNIDGAALATLIAERIHEQSAKPIEIPCISSAEIYNPGGADWGKRYIDVDLEEQHARMYDASGELIWESECVSGGPAEGNDTVTGVFYVEDRISPMTLIGLDSDGDGEPDYENDVTYWMPFWGGYGFHDAVWRSTFGGEEYLYDGSHGCVNLPYDAAEELYFNVKVGDPVVVHW